MAAVLRWLTRRRPGDVASHIDSLDTKAGILSGFLAVTVATAAGTKDFVEAAKSYGRGRPSMAGRSRARPAGDADRGGGETLASLESAGPCTPLQEGKTRLTSGCPVTGMIKAVQGRA